jgi:hypothetical protein
MRSYNIDSYFPFNLIRYLFASEFDLKAAAVKIVDVYAAPHLNSNEVEYDKSPSAGTGSILAQHGEELNFNKGDTPPRRNLHFTCFYKAQKNIFSYFK